MKKLTRFIGGLLGSLIPVFLVIIGWNWLSTHEDKLDLIGMSAFVLILLVLGNQWKLSETKDMLEARTKQLEDILLEAHPDIWHSRAVGNAINEKYKGTPKDRQNATERLANLESHPTPSQYKMIAELHQRQMTE